MKDLIYTTIIPAGDGLLARQIVLREISYPEHTDGPRYVVHTRIFDDAANPGHVKGDYYKHFREATERFRVRAMQELQPTTED